MLHFSRALVAGDFEAAHGLLAEPLSRELSAELLETRFKEMISYGDGPAEHTEIITSFTEWPDRQAGDLGWVYAAITGSNFSEAVSGVVTHQGLIRQLEWGRP